MKTHEKSKNKSNKAKMDQLTNVILTTDKVDTSTQRALDCKPGLGGIN